VYQYILYFNKKVPKNTLIKILMGLKILSHFLLIVLKIVSLAIVLFVRLIKIVTKGDHK